MNKIKINIIYSAFLLLIGSFVLSGAHANAATPGCYTNDVGTYKIVACPTELTTQAAAPGYKCFVSTTTTGSPTASSFTETNCTAITDTSTDLTHGLGQFPLEKDSSVKYCGRGPNAPDDRSNEVKVSFDFGCVGDDYSKYKGLTLNPIVDIGFAIFRFLSVGVGLVVIGSIMVAGIQYSASRGDPQATNAAIKRISNSLIALLIYIFMFGIINFLVPGGMFL